MSKFLVIDEFGSPFASALLEATGVKPEMVRRLVLDLQVGSVGRLYIETFADDEMLNVKSGDFGVVVEGTE